MTSHSQPAIHDWACQTLDIEWSSDSARLTQHIPDLLTLITQSDYVLSIDQADAALIVAELITQPDRPPLIASESVSLWCNEQGAQAIARFRTDFFELTCDERSRRWQLLANEYSDHPDLKLQLLALKRGVRFAMPTGPMDARQQSILRTCCNVFVSAPTTAASLRRSFRHKCRADETWEEAVNEVFESHREFVEEIAPWIGEFRTEGLWESRPSGSGLRGHKWESRPGGSGSRGDNAAWNGDADWRSRGNHTRTRPSNENQWSAKPPPELFQFKTERSFDPLPSRAPSVWTIMMCIIFGLIAMISILEWMFEQLN